MADAVAMTGEIERKASPLRGSRDARHLYNYAANGSRSATRGLKRRGELHHERPSPDRVRENSCWFRRLLWKVSGPDPLENAIVATFQSHLKNELLHLSYATQGHNRV